MCHVLRVVCCVSLTPTATVTDPPPANSPSRLVRKDPKTQIKLGADSVKRCAPNILLTRLVGIFWGTLAIIPIPSGTLQDRTVSCAVQYYSIVQYTTVLYRAVQYIKVQ